MRDGPIGVFDSGVGGMSVLRHIRAELPWEDLIYVADSAHVPYGNKSPGYIRGRASSLAAFLVDQGAKALVIACNTATAAAAAHLRAAHGIPIIAMEPAVKPAAAATRSGVVGVLATEGTLRSAKFAALLERVGGGVRIVTQPCPGLVDQVERGELDGPTTRGMVKRYLGPLLHAGADAVILGCTHYPYLSPLIQELAGPGVAVIETGPAVARHLRRSLRDRELLARGRSPGKELFWSSAAPEAAAAVIRRLWGGEPDVRAVPSAYVQPPSLMITVR